MKSPEFLIVGSGITGATIARILSDSGKDVLVLERRDCLGGNVHDHKHQSGIIVHTYGPHYFRTSSTKIWEFVNRFSGFYKYEASLFAKDGSTLVNWPLWKSQIKNYVGDYWQPGFIGNPKNFEEAALSIMPKIIYDKFVKEYNEKQWGIPAKSLDKELCYRFDVRDTNEARLKPNATYQGIPLSGYAKLMENMLDKIPCELNCDFIKKRHLFKARTKIIYTGPIDQYFEYKLGKLDYRAQKRYHEFYDNTSFMQKAGQINTPQHIDGGSIRSLEWKHMMQKDSLMGIKGTLITREVPFSPDDPNDYEYPFPNKKNSDLYVKYREIAQQRDDVIICGRLGEYKYFDMDQAIGHAMKIASGILGK